METLNGLNLSSPPVWAKSLIVAELEHDKCDTMTDYFATQTSRVVALAWSKHNRDLFPELRKAAASFPETAHLGPGKGVFKAQIVVATDINSPHGCYWKGQPSHWHNDLMPEAHFLTRFEAELFVAGAAPAHPIMFDGVEARFEWEIVESKIEHREKYSMGHGYYLKAAHRYDNGWVVRKEGLWIVRRQQQDAAQVSA